MKKLFYAILACSLAFFAACDNEELNQLLNGGGTDQVKISLDRESAELTVGETLQLAVTVEPQLPAGPKVIWSSSDPDVATVTTGDEVAADGTYLPAGLVTAVAEGEATITASIEGKEATCTVTVKKGGETEEEEVAIEGITLNESSLTLKEGEKFQLEASLLPETATPKTIEWISSVPAVATVDENGLVTAVRNGATTVWAVIGRGSGHDINAKCEVTVTSDAPSVESITVTPATVTIKTTEETILTATVTPDGTGAEIKWTSDKPSIAKVEKISDTQAKVTGVGVGTVKVIASVGSVFGFSEVTVEKKASDGGEGGVEMISLNKTELQLGFYQTEQLIATLRPEGVSAQITWISSNEDVVLVSNGDMPAADGSIKPAGTVIAKNKAGQAVVTATVGSLSASCTVTVSSGSVVPVQSISLNRTELTLEPGQQFELIATILPENATNKVVSWSSTARSNQLSLSDNGLSCMIGALAECEATITVRSADNPAQLYATCKVTVTGGSSADPGEEVVDLGLPSGLKWRSMNVGASKPEDYGNYYAWAETSPKSSYSSSNYKYPATNYGDGIIAYAKYDTTPYQGDGKTVLEPEDDAATANLGNGWRTPTFKEWKELRENCTWTWKTQNGVNGMLVTGPNGKSIFLPAGGWYENSTLKNKTTYGSYWTATGDGGTANAVDFINNDKDKALVPRCEGRSVRPVMD